jgi:hypothetical protein
MINKDKIFSYLDESFRNVVKLNKEHKNRVNKAIDWFNENVIDKSTETFSGSKVKVNNITAICVENDFRGAPYFECYFIFMPYNVKDDCGGGCGNQYIVKF